MSKSAGGSIAKKNDLYRRDFTGCRIVLTVMVAESNDRVRIIEAVRTFVKFNSENDPYSERDFAFFEVGSDRYFFKFEYFDSNYVYFQEDGNPVLTIGHASEY